MTTVEYSRANNGEIKTKYIFGRDKAPHLKVNKYILASLYNNLKKGTKDCVSDTISSDKSTVPLMTTAYINYDKTGNVFWDTNRYDPKVFTDDRKKSLYNYILVEVGLYTFKDRLWYRMKRVGEDNNSDCARMLKEMYTAVSQQYYRREAFGGTGGKDLLFIPFEYVEFESVEIPVALREYTYRDRTLVAHLFDSEGKEVCTLSEVTNCRGKYVGSDDSKYYKSCTLKTQYYKLQSEVPVMEDNGCIDCKDSEYYIDSKGVHLRCTKCGKMVLEKEYDGMGYPEYCNRNIAKQINRYNQLLNRFGDTPA